MATFVALAGAHLLSALAATLLAVRSRLYSRGRLALQVVLALLVPVLGPAWVILMWSESEAEISKPSTNAWIRQETGEG